MTIRVTCPKCPECGDSAVMTLDALAFEVWRNGGMVQHCFPDVPREEREQLITGIHPACWTKMFPPEKEE